MRTSLGKVANKTFDPIREEQRLPNSSLEAEGTSREGLELPMDFAKTRVSSSFVASSMSHDSPRLTAEVVHVEDPHERRAGHRKENYEEVWRQHHLTVW